MRKRIIINLLIAFLLIPAVKLTWDYIRIEINHDYSAYSGTFQEYEKMIAATVFLGLPALFLLFILLPYNLIITNYKKPRKLNLFHKFLIFEGVLLVFLCLVGSFMNIWFSPISKNLWYIAGFLPISIVCASLIHFFVDGNSVNDRIV